MKKYLTMSALCALVFGGVTYVSAHEVRTYEINSVPYEFVVGSLGEPVIVDDKSGVDFELVRDGKPVVGAQSSLQVELSAGDKKKIESFSPVYGVEGRYKTTFIPTVATTLHYRIFGTLEGTPIDLSFTCNPAGHPQSEENKERVDVAPGVVQTGKSGAFGCPQAKEAFGFPEPATESVSVAGRIASLESGEKMSRGDGREKQRGAKALIPIVALLTVGLIVIAVVMVRKGKAEAPRG
jgi:hypothetical protein